MLAISVFAHHFAITMQWQATGRWDLTSSPAWNALGHGAVTLFFMITGFLFFGKISNPTKGFGYLSFLKARVLRIYPVYLVCVAAVAVIALATPDHTVGFMSAATSMGLWLLFCPQRLFGMDHAGLAVAYAPWSLRYEWCFYLSLPVLAMAWRSARFHPAFVILLSGVALCLAQWPLAFDHGSMSLDTRFIAPFALGGAALTLLRYDGLGQWARGPIGSAVTLLAMVAVCTQEHFYSVTAYLVLTVAFVPIAAGATLFGLLRMPAMRVLGAISYDVYILHGLVLFAFFHLLAPSALIDQSVLVLILVLFTTGTVVIGLSLAVHRLIEVPAMGLSLRLRAADPRERLAAP